MAHKAWERDVWQTNLWLEKTHDEQLAEGAKAMATDILEQVQLKAREYQYVSCMLDIDYSQLDKDCASHQRAHFSRSYNAWLRPNS